MKYLFLWDKHRIGIDSPQSLAVIAWDDVRQQVVDRPFKDSQCQLGQDWLQWVKFNKHSFRQLPLRHVGIIEFRSKDAYKKAKRKIKASLTGGGRKRKADDPTSVTDDDWSRSRRGLTVADVQGLIQPLGYKRYPLNQHQIEAIKLDYKRGAGLAKIAYDWDISEREARRICLGNEAAA